MRIWNALSHLTIILSLMFVTFFIIDRINPAMNFLTSELSRWLILALSLTSLSLGITTAVKIWRAKMDEYKSDRKPRS